MALKAPFPYYGAKTRCAHLAWQALGHVGTYIEPFFGSGAVLFARPSQPKIEIVNDKNAYITNVWRAIKMAPDEVAAHAEGPIHEADLTARHRALLAAKPILQQLEEDSEYFDAKLAGWWIWGACSWIGDGWCGGSTSVRLPQLFSWRGVHRAFSGPTYDPSEQLEFSSVCDWIRALAHRLARVRVASGDWQRVLAPSITCEYDNSEKYDSSRLPVGIFLDPPYDGFEDQYGGNDGVNVAQDVAAWAREHGGDKRLRVVLCGYVDDYDLPGWSCIAWKSKGGHEKAGKERLWLSPHCVHEQRGKQAAGWGF